MLGRFDCRYRYLNELGSGSFGNVVLAQDTHSLELVAVKKLPRLPDDMLQLERELLVHSRLRHPHVVRFHEVFLSPNHYNLVLEYVPDGTLLRHLRHHGALPEHQARWLFQQLILAVDYCHSAGVSNRDIKLDNILLDKSSRGRPDWPIVKLADWGQSFARAGAASEACSKVGTLAYMAPEVLAHRSYNPKRADIWSCGVVLYACLCGCMPFALADEQLPLAESLQRLVVDIKHRRFALPERLSEGAQDLLNRLLHPEPQARIDMAGILAHPWFALGLPQGAMAMNESFLRMPRACNQSEEEIWRLIRHASALEPRLALDSCRLPWPFSLNTRRRSSNYSNAASSEPCEAGSSPSVRLQTVA